MKNNLSNSSSSILIREDGQDGVTNLILNRPEKYNSLSHELIRLIQEELDSIAHDSSVKVIILKGRGQAFCAGHDISEMIRDSDESAIRNLFEKCSKMMITLTRMPQPVISQIHGIATAAGCQLVAQSDLAVASENASFATSGIGIGLYCGTPSVAVTRNIPRKQAMEMLLTGDFIKPDQALQYGLINKVAAQDKLDESVRELALKVAEKGQEFVKRGKQLFYNQIESGIEAAYQEATKFMTEHFKLKSTQAGLNAFLEKKPMPDWSKNDV